MKPQDMEVWVGLRKDVAVANQALEDFQARDVELVPEAQGKTPNERMDNLWSSIRGSVPEARGYERPNGGYHGISQIRRIVMDPGEGTYYHLFFTLSRNRHEERSIEATWLRFDGGEFTGEQREALLEPFSGDNYHEGQLHDLADLEWSLVAYGKAT